MIDYDVLLQAITNYPTFEQLLTESIAISRQKNPKITNYNVGGVYRTLLEVNSELIKQLYDLLKEHIVPNLFVVTARGSWLDLHAAGLGIERKPAKKAVGYVLFRREDTSGNVLIPKGTIIKTPPNIFGEELRYITIEEKVLQDGQSEIAVKVESEETGAKYNVGEGMISILTTYIPGIDSVYNSPDWLIEEGTDQEDDESLRQRCILRWATLSLQIADYYKYWALSIDGVVDVEIDDQHPRGQGTVDVYIVSTAGLPTSDLITKVQEVMNIKKTPAADVLVKAPTPKAIDIDITIYTYPGFTEIDLIKAEAERRINALFVYNEEYKSVIFDYDNRRFRISKDVTISSLIYPLMEIAGVSKVEINSPSADVPVAKGELPVINSLNVTVVEGIE